MKRRLLAGFLALVMALALLPASAFAASDIPDGYVPIYTLADLKENIGSGYYLLMNDIDASKEDIAYDTLNDAACGSLLKGGVINGNSHTIYNLKGTLIERNLGTIKNLNVSVINIDKDNDVLGTDSGICGIAYYNSYGDDTGLIENCNVSMTVRRSFDKLNIGFITCGIARGCGSIRNCIVDLDINLKYTGTNKDSDISVAGIGDDSRFADIDSCLVMGSVNIQTPGYARLAGISDEDSKNSANALEKANVECTSTYRSAYDFFTLSSASSARNSGGQSINNRVADDLEVNYTFNDRVALDGKPDAESKLYTLASRDSILNDWDISDVPSEIPPEKPEPGDNTPVTVDFNFEGNVGHTQSWQFEYSDDYFYAQDDGYGYNAKLAKASLCLEMTTFSTNANTTWRGNGDATALSRTENVRELLNKLNFSSLKYVNYDVPLDNTSDKVAYTLAMKYITNKNGGTDTLIAVPIRGGGYGGEWASNFNVYNSEEKLSRNHYGFQTAANGVLSGLSDYVQSHEIKGDLKIWAVGFSRGAAVANLLGRALNNATIGGIKPNVVDIYVYTFATPAGASHDSAETFFDPNIYNIVSPVDLVPRVAPTAWGFTRYGTTLSLPYESSSKLWDKFEEIAGMYTREIKPSQRAFFDRFCEVAFTNDPGGSVFGTVNYTDIQKDIMDFTGSELGTPPVSPFEKGDTLRCVLSNDTRKYVLGCAAFNYTLIPYALMNLNTLGLAHYPEHYLAHLEVDNLQSEDDFVSSYHARTVLVYPPADKQLKSYDIKVDFWNAKGQSAGSYANGACSSGEVSVELTDIGLIASLPEGAEYSFTVSGADAGNVGAKIYSYDGADIEPARTVDFEALPSSDGNACTVFVPEDIYSDYYALDSDGNIYEPDSDSDYPDEPDEPDEPYINNFTDVHEGSFYYDAVLWAVNAGITNGTTDTTFSPNASCTRAQVVTFLWRAAGCPEPESSVCQFVDVPKGSFYYKAVMWAAEEGITTGVTADHFQPGATVTRAQVVTFLWRWDLCPKASSSSGFVDVSKHAFYTDAVDWAVEYGITKGTTAKTFSPNDKCMRSQIVTFLYRYFVVD